VGRFSLRSLVGAIGNVPRHAGCPYDQSFGLLQEPPKPNIGYRQYPKEALERLHFIRRAQELGFSLKEISMLLAVGDNAPERRAMAEQKNSLRGIPGSLDWLPFPLSSKTDSSMRRNSRCDPFSTRLRPLGRQQSHLTHCKIDCASCGPLVCYPMYDFGQATDEA